MTDARLDQIASLWGNRDVDEIIAEVRRLRAALQAPLLHGSTAGYVYIDYEDDEDMYIDSRRVAPDLDTAREWAGTRKVYALMDLSLFGEPDD